MSAEVFDDAYLEAKDALQSAMSYQVPRGEQVLNNMGDKAVAISDSPTTSILASSANSLDFAAIKAKVGEFAQHCATLGSVLDEVASLHPFIRVAVLPFKAALHSELNRRENDQKALALLIVMSEMMWTLQSLTAVQTGARINDGPTIEERLRHRMVMVANSVKNCAEICHSYQKRHVAVKFFTSVKWQSKFTTVSDEFADHQASIQRQLQLFISIKVTKIHAVVSEFVDMGAMMKMVFENMHSPKDLEFANLVRLKGGRPDDPNEPLLNEIIQQSKGSDARDNALQQVFQQSSLPSDPKHLRAEIDKDVEVVLEENRKAFKRAFDYMKHQLKDLKVTMKHEGDRVIREVLDGVRVKGPQERIKDKDVYEIWDQMGWRGRAEATHLVMELHEHYSVQSSVQALSSIRAIANEAEPGSPTANLKDIASIAQQALPTPNDDLWALPYISVRYAQPLIEAIDGDGSSFVTVAEVNAFTSSRPVGWSLPHWIAYWAIGFEMSTHWYYRRIRQLFIKMLENLERISPLNRKVASDFCGSWPIQAIQNHFSGLRKVAEWQSTDFRNDSIFLRFKPWILENEKNMEENLRRLVYNIQDNTLRSVTGGGRPEKYMMPLFYLLLRRCNKLLESAGDVVLHVDELSTVQNSLSTVLSAIQERVRKLEAVHALQHVKKEELGRLFFGLYTYTFQAPEVVGLRSHDFSPPYDLGNEDIDLGEPEPGLDHGPQASSFDFALVSTSPVAQPLLDTDYRRDSCIGAWNISLDHCPEGDESEPVDLSFSFSITHLSSTGPFHGSGVDLFGPFSIHGQTIEGRIIFVKFYEGSKEVPGARWGFDGTFNDEGIVTGRWVTPPDTEMESLIRVEGVDFGPQVTEVAENVDPQEGGSPTREDVGEIEAILEPSISPATPTDVGEDDMQSSGQDCGIFTMKPRLYGTILYHPSIEELQSSISKPQAHWALLRDAANSWIRTRFSKQGFEDSRSKRNLCFTLWRYSGERSTAWASLGYLASFWPEIARRVHPDDLQLWYAWYKFHDFVERREFSYPHINCDKCSRRGISSSRLVCKDCWGSDTVDLCLGCQSTDCYRELDHKDHKSSHTLIQLRKPVFYIDLRPLMSYAISLLDELPDESEKYCSFDRCKNKEKQLEDSYWLCTECEEPTFVCTECNTREGNLKLWTLQNATSPSEEGHRWSHTMVLRTKKDEATEEELCTDERLANLESSLEAKANDIQAVQTTISERMDALEDFLKRQAEHHVAFETSVSDRMQKLEMMMEKVLTAVTQPHAKQ